MVTCRLIPWEGVDDWGGADIFGGVDSKAGKMRFAEFGWRVETEERGK